MAKEITRNDQKGNLCDIRMSRRHKECGKIFDPLIKADRYEKGTQNLNIIYRGSVVTEGRSYFMPVTPSHNNADGRCQQNIAEKERKGNVLSL
jgi:hypothetical protein